MDFIDKVRELAAQAPKIRDGELVRTEEGTKNALVMPFINALGYNVFDPTEVTPELVADVGVKKGEKVDYAVLKDRKPIMLFECKCCGVNLNDVHASQLYRYFSVTDARFGILTDGIVYHFYTDLEAPNKMDAKPFFVFDMTNFSEAEVAELKKFTKSAFDLGNIMTTANELKYKREIKRFLTAQLVMPADEFVKLMLEGSGVHPGRKTQTVIDDFRDVVQDAFVQFVNEQLEAKFKSFMSGEVKLVEQGKPADEGQEEGSAQPTDGSPVVTTEEELEGFRIIRAIVCEVVDVKRVFIRDAHRYCAILLDDSNRKTIARLHFNSAKKYLGLLDAQKNEERIALDDLDDIYKYADRLKVAVRIVLA
jgi:predicted type IV restriction endonuclease